MHCHRPVSNTALLLTTTHFLRGRSVKAGLGAVFLILPRRLSTHTACKMCHLLFYIYNLSHHELYQFLR